MPRLRRLILIAALALLAAQPARARMFDPESFTLANGLQVVVVPNHRVPILSHMVWYKVGAADEETGKSGLAHLLEHLMFKGTRTLGPGEFSKVVARNGGRDNAFTSSDYTGYYQNVAVDKLDLVMGMEADRMANLILDQANFTTERAVVLEERRSRVENNPAALLSEQMEAALFLNSPYHRPVIGWESEIAALSLDDALAFYGRWYAPNNAILVVAGDVDAAAVRPLAEKHFGHLKPSAALPQRLRAEEPPPRAARRLSLTDARVAQPSLTRLYLAPSAKAGDTNLAPALEVLAEAMGGGATSLLYRSLVVEQGLAAAASTSYDSTATGLTSFRFGLVPNAGVGLERLEAALDKEIAAIVKNGIPQAEVIRAKQRLVASAAFARDSLHTGAQALGQALAVGLSVAEVESWPDQIEAVSPELVAKAATRVLDAKGSVTGQLLPDPAAPKSGRPAAQALPTFPRGVH